MASPDTPSTQAPVCYRHPDRETRLSCSECGKPICADCSHDSAVGQRCAECAKPKGRNRVVSSRDLSRTNFSTSPITFTLIGISVALFAAGFLLRDIEVQLVQYLALGEFVETPRGLGVAPIDNVDPWRVLTSAFLHGGLMHVAFNMYAIYLFGPRLEREAGGAPYLLAYAASATAGGAAFLFAQAGETSYAVGASGAVFGLFGIWLIATYRMRHNPAGRAMFNQLIALLAINGALPLFIPNIAWEAHLGGLAAGALIGFLWGKLAAGRPNSVRIRTIIAAVVFALSAALVFVV